MKCPEGCNLCCYAEKGYLNVIVPNGDQEKILLALRYIRPCVKINKEDIFIDQVFGVDAILTMLRTDKNRPREIDIGGKTLIGYPCVALNPESGKCDIYDDKPLFCSYYDSSAPCSNVRGYKFV